MTDNTTIAPLREGFSGLMKGRDRVFVLTDENTSVHCYPYFIEHVGIASPVQIRIPLGEAHKNISTCDMIWDRLMSEHAGRNDLFINLGGGVVCDIGGFAASLFKRGMDFINVPTTLLAMTDAAIGGKTGVNFQGIKNMLGTNQLAEHTWIDSHFLKTLPEAELKSGYAEMIKHGLISDSDYLRELMRQEPGIIPSEELIRRSVEIKSAIVAEDRFEKGLRKLLNFGHTIGHAIESYSLEHHSQPLTHGYAVALGMVAEMGLSLSFLETEKKAFEEVIAWLQEHFPLSEEFDSSELMRLMQHDKKNNGRAISFVLLRSPGDPVVDQFPSEDQIMEALSFLPLKITSGHIG